ncbi:MAG TPA: TIGR03619 family F420-dependent LLM class oxidoreductase [Chloroflexi bacterium]|nr:TIGR03619 family F420-dependent LLM class oxidoreductase [Chloroflexota bacterium]HPO57484.1 TIGR03619 family F420-dependent LLM class oxidoreductase [Anaerolineaceae bacterium]
MNFGVILPNFGPGASRMDLLDTALAAERLGFDSGWLTDHLALPQQDAERYGHIFEVLTTMGYLAASTQRLRLGISALVLPQRNPLEVGKQLTTLDVLSGGRVMVAAGVGWSEGEYRNLGKDFSNRGERMDEAIRLLRTLWRGGRVISFRGKHYPFEKVVFSPGPVQSGGPTLWVAGESDRALRRAVNLGDGWHPNARSPQILREKLEKVAPMLAGRPFTVSLRMRVAVNRPPKTERTLAGSPDEVADQLRAYQQAGMNYAVIAFEAANQGERERAMRLFAEKVAPQFRG